MKEEDVSSQNVNPRSNRNSVASASASVSATAVDKFRRQARSPSPPHTAVAVAAASSAGASSPAVLVNAGSVDWTGHGLGSAGRPCRPWDRGDLLRRLATFKPSNWLGKPKTASSLACAQKGWVSVDLDKLQCENCGANLHYSPPPDSLNHPEGDGVREEFSKQLGNAHESSCPWVGNSCPESLVQFPPTPPSALIGVYKDRCDGLLQFYSLPIVSLSAIEQMRASRRLQIDRLLAHPQLYANDDLSFRMDNISAAGTSKDEALSDYARAQKLISLCGWEPRWLPNIQDCEEHSAQSARNGRRSGPARNQSRLQDPGPSRNQFSASSRKASGNYEVLGPEYKSESRSPLLDCSLCGVTIRIWDFMTTSRPAPLAPINANLPETSKKMGMTRGNSATSGINGWFANESMEQQQNEDVDEAETSAKRTVVSNIGISLYQTAAGASSSAQLNMSVTRDNYQFSDRGKEVFRRQPSGSEVGNRATSYESRGPSTCKRSLEDGGSTADRPNLRIQHADSIEGTVVDRDEVNDDSAGPSKRTRGSDVHEVYPPLYGRDLSVGGPSHSLGAENDREVNRSDPFSEGNEQAMAFPGARDSTRASSVIAMDTICHSDDDDSMESVENHPRDFDDINFPSVATAQSVDFNDPSELNFSNQAQQSACFQPAPVQSNAELGISSINDGEEVLNTETVTVQGRDGPSLGVSGGSVGMGASHEGEIHGADVSVHRGDSVVGDVEPVAEVIENLGQSGEFAPDQGLSDDFVPEEMDQDDRPEDSQDRVSQSVARADSSSKIVDSLKAESVESGEKMSNINLLMNDDIVLHPSLSCNAIVCSAYEASKEEVTQTLHESPLDAGFALPGSSHTANGQGPPNGDSNDEVVEFDPIKYHNCYCPWVNENVAAAGCSSNSSSSSGFEEAVCGWQLTLDALDSFQSLDNAQIQTMESESAASLCKDDHQTPSQKLFKRHSFISSHGNK